MSDEETEKVLLFLRPNSNPGVFDANDISLSYNNYQVDFRDGEVVVKHDPPNVEKIRRFVDTGTALVERYNPDGLGVRFEGEK